MKNFQNKVSLILAVVITPLANFMGGFDLFIRILVGIMIGDFIFGYVNARINDIISSKKMAIGGVKKIMTLMLIGLSTQLGIAFEFPQLRMIVISYYLLMEFVSIMEHANDLEIPLPNYLKKLVKFLVGELEDKEINERGV